MGRVTWVMPLVKVTELLKAIMDAMMQGGVRCERGGESVCVGGWPVMLLAKTTDTG